MGRRITKVKYVGGKVEIHYEVEKQDGQLDEYTLKCTDLPTPEFVKALENLRPDVATWLELDPEWANNVEIRGVSFSWSNDVMGAVITALKPLELSNSPMIINTPHKPEEPYGEDPDESQVDKCLSSECVDNLRDLLTQAGKYVDGDREQGTLFEVEQKETEPAAVGAN